MQEEHKKRIEEIIGGMQCPKNFKCCDSDFANLCKAEDIGVDSFLKCLEEDQNHCKFALSFGHGFLCRCPLRIYIAKKLNK